ncbi:MAG: calcium-translocating P-type ATPase, PMCA-type [candidate division WOR-3 bacterium]|nr:calcium-translocating P-type ATPase, PMCA-type [candidate division WOR-3 bacterium]
MEKEYWHTLSIEAVFESLRTSAQGLNSEEARLRLEKFGPNEIKEAKKKTILEMFLDQFKDFMILILIAAAIISGIVGEPIDTIAIIVIVILNGVIGFIQEYRAEKAIAALKKMAQANVNVLRNNIVYTIPVSEVVPGDVVLLEAGNIVPADLRLIEVAQLKIDESPLTGESTPVEKFTREFHDPTIPLGDRKNMAYKGTIVTYGRGAGVAVATGMSTELGKIATMIQEEEEVKTPLQKRLAKFGQSLAFAVLVICAIVFIFGVLRGEPLLLMVLTSISLAVAVIPEALPAVVTISLALGAKKMVKMNALIRKLSAVETLGSITYICSDKTGTLTQNKMIVREIYTDDKIVRQGNFIDYAEKNLELFLALALSNDAQYDKDGRIIGDPTETALCVAAFEAGYDKRELIKRHPRIAEIPFDSDRKCMTTIHKMEDGRIISFTKGAIDSLIERAEGYLNNGEIKKDLETLSKANIKMANEGLRVLAIAMREWKELPANLNPANIEDKLIILGLVGMIDPPRPEVEEAIRQCKGAGIIPVMITGDHPITARAIAHQLGIIEDDARAVITGKELDSLSLEEFEKRVEHIRVYARVAPEQKLKIVKALQDKGQFVAMTGDGVNDAPALKRADIGVAMGIMGTEVSKEASHMILLDDNFATIVKAVREGRRIFDNIRKFIKYTMTSNSGELWTIFLAPFFGLPIPLLPIHILWINLVTDGLPGLALAAEPAEKGIMKRPPRHPQESIFAHGLGIHIIWVGLLMGFVSIFTQFCSIEAFNADWQTMVFTVLCLSQMGHALAIRSERESLFTQGIFSNRPLLGAVFLTFLLQLCVIYIPFLHPIFKTKPLTIPELMLCIVLSSIVFLAVEIEKMIKRSKEKRR